MIVVTLDIKTLWMKETPILYIASFKTNLSVNFRTYGMNMEIQFWIIIKTR